MFPYDTKLGELVNMLKDRLDVQRDLDRMEEWAGDFQGQMQSPTLKKE